MMDIGTPGVRRTCIMAWGRFVPYFWDGRLPKVPRLIRGPGASATLAARP